MPGSPFAYWVNAGILQTFVSKNRLACLGRIAVVGVQTSDDTRFLRAWWEVYADFLPFAKGGQFSTFYADIPLSIKWNLDGEELKASVAARYGIVSKHVQNQKFYYLPGLTYSRRTTSGLSVRVMPQCCIFADKEPAIFAADDNHLELLALLALVNSAAFQLLVEVQLAAADAAARSYEVGLIQQTPVPDRTPESTVTLATFARRAWSLKRRLDTVTQTSHTISGKSCTIYANFV